MGTPLDIFLLIGAMTFTSTEVIKSVIRIFTQKARVGILISIIFNILFMLALGEGLLHRVLSVDYTTTAIPELFRYLDMFLTGFVICILSQRIDKFIDFKKIAQNMMAVKTNIAPSEDIKTNDIIPVDTVTPIIEDIPHEVIIEEPVAAPPKKKEVKTVEPAPVSPFVEESRGPIEFVPDMVIEVVEDERGV